MRQDGENRRDDGRWLVCFFQAEDGIRDKLVTGVQTCALPISSNWRRPCPSIIATGRATSASADTAVPATSAGAGQPGAATSVHHGTPNNSASTATRSEERRVGKECSTRGTQDE